MSSDELLVSMCRNMSTGARMYHSLHPAAYVVHPSQCLVLTTPLFLLACLFVFVVCVVACLAAMLVVSDIHSGDTVARLGTSDHPELLGKLNSVTAMHYNSAKSQLLLGRRDGSVLVVEP